MVRLGARLLHAEPARGLSPATTPFSYRRRERRAAEEREAAALLERLGPGYKGSYDKLQSDQHRKVWTIDVLDSVLQPKQSIHLPPGTCDVGRELLGTSDLRISRKQLELTLPTGGGIAMLKLTGANPSILQSATGTFQELTKSTPAVTVGPGDIIWLRRRAHPIRVVAPTSAPDALHLMDLPEELCRHMLRNAITLSPWPGGWAVFRLVSRQAYRFFLEVAGDLPPELSWLLARSCCHHNWSEFPAHDVCPARLHEHVHPPLASVWAGRVIEVHLAHVGLEDDGLLRLLHGMHTQPHTRLFEISYNHFTRVGFKALADGMMYDNLMPELRVLLMRETTAPRTVPDDVGRSRICPIWLLQHPRETLEDEWDAFEGAVVTFEHSERCKALELFDWVMVRGDWVQDW